MGYWPLLVPISPGCPTTAQVASFAYAVISTSQHKEIRMTYTPFRDVANKINHIHSHAAVVERRLNEFDEIDKQSVTELKDAVMKISEVLRDLDERLQAIEHKG